MTSPSASTPLTRRDFMQGAAVTAGTLAGVGLLGTGNAQAATPRLADFVARAPAGFQPLVLPGRVAKASAKGSFDSFMQKNQLWPQAEVAKRLFEKAMMDLTGAANAAEAMKRFIHKDDVVAIKPNGIAGQKGHTMAVNFELILPVVEAVLAVGVPAERITVYEQYPSYLNGTRVNLRDWKLPNGVRTGTHNNAFHSMPAVKIYQGIPTKYCTFFTDATAVIDMTMIKDHSICGYTGTLKNITHGNINNPEEHHAHNASPQIAMLYNHPVVTSRVRLHLVDAFKITYDGGPLDKRPEARIPHGAVYASTDPVALDRVGLDVVEAARRSNKLKSLKEAGREARYLKTAAELGLGVYDLNEIRLTQVEI